MQCHELTYLINYLVNKKQSQPSQFTGLEGLWKQALYHPSTAAFGPRKDVKLKVCRESSRQDNRQAVGERVSATISESSLLLRHPMCQI